MNWTNRLILGVNVGLALIVLFSIVRYGSVPPPRGWEWRDLVTILLTAISVILVAVTIIIAVVGVLGYQTIRNSSQKAAMQVAERVARESAQSVAQRTATETVALMQRTPVAGGRESWTALAEDNGDTDDGLDR